MRSRIISSMAVITMLFLLAACGGGGGGTTDQPKPELTGQFIDSAVAGLYYEASPSGLTGTTDANGTFKYKAGDTIEFYVGDILIGSASAEPVMTPVTLVVGAVDEAHAVVISIAAFLQSLDSDGNLSNGIQIDPAIAAAADGKTLDFTSATFAADAAAVLAAMAADAAIVGFSGALVDPGDAMSHLGDSLSTCDHTGTYSGTWVQTAGPDSDNGTWTMSVSATGSVTGSGSSNVFTGESFTMTGSVSADGTTTAGSTDSGAVFNGTVAADGTLSGTWSNSSFGSSGTFTGTRASSAVSCSSSSPSDPGGDSPVDTSAFAGTYSGTLDGTVAGSWTFTVDSSGNLTGTAMPDTGGTVALSASLDATGVFNGTVTDSSAINGSISSDGTVSGVLFLVTAAGVHGGGWFSGSQVNNGTSGGGGGGSSTVDTSAFAGTYTGTYTGEDTGTWTFIIDAIGGLTGTVISDTNGSGSIAAEVSSTGEISGGGMTGTISADGSISGTWPGTSGAVGNNYSGSRVSG